jgi:quercetin dioxygenase-like cupin family protein
MIETSERWEGTPYPDLIRGLPEIEIAVEGIKGWLVQAPTTQIVFFDIQPVGTIPPHAHCAQWGMVIEGEMALTIGGETKTYRKGDWYFIPAGVEHSAAFPARVQVMDVFDAPDRYRAKK